MVMTGEERLKKSQIRLQGDNPFFSYLSLFLKLHKDNGMMDRGEGGIGVDINGNLYFDEHFIDAITDDELKGVLCHEILHCSLVHLARRKNRNPQGWNISADLATNQILVENNFQLPRKFKVKINGKFEECSSLVPYNGEYNFQGTTIAVKGKTAEQLYDELADKFKGEKSGNQIQKGKGKKKGKGSGSGDGDEDKQGRGFDEHKETGDGKELSESERSKLENEWLGRIEEAYMSAKQRGNVPEGIERYIGELRKSQVNWRALLQKHIKSFIQTDSTWARRGKKSLATGVYLPSPMKEGKVEVVIAIDTSGSIGQEELTGFVSEIVGMAKAFKSEIDMRVLFHDCEVQADYEVGNGSIPKIMAMKVVGGGGTSHEPVFQLCKEKYKKTKCLICFTDGCSDIENIKFKDYPFEKIFIINHTGDGEYLKDMDCKYIKMINTGEHE